MPEIPSDYWRVVGAFVENEASRRGLTIDGLSKQAGLSRQTVSKLANGKPLEGPSLARIEGALELPRDLLLYIALGDAEAIEEATADPDLTRWIGRKLREITDHRMAADALADPVSLNRTERRQKRDLRTVVDPSAGAAAHRGPKSQVDNPEPHAE